MNKQTEIFILTLCLSAGLSLTGSARQGPPPMSRRQNVQPLGNVDQLVMPPTDVAAELAADARNGTAPLRFAAPAVVQATPATRGTWQAVAGGSVWRLRVVSAGATDLNFGFSIFLLPQGATLHIYSEEEDYIQGPYEARDNKPHGQLWTPVVPGSRAVIELFVPNGVKEEPRLMLSFVNRGYRDLFHRRKELSIPKSGGCNIDVVCPQGDPWRNEIRSVALYSVGGSALCTGTLINDVSHDFKNYFLTANHCGINSGNAASIVVYWNFQSPVCGQQGGGSLGQNQSGAAFRMSKSDVDVTLIELEDIPEASFRVYYSGWDRSGVTPGGAVGIHHPNGDEKSISFANSSLATANSCIGSGSSTHWRVLWNVGVTEPGSSGSAIWDPSRHRIVGTLSGGDSSCSFPEGPDCYGKFSVAWASGNNANSRLRDWLDPANMGVTAVAGRDPNPFSIASTLLTESCTPTNGVIDPGETVTVSFSLRNLAAPTSTNLIATLLATNGVMMPSGPENYGVVVAGGGAVARNFSFVANGPCGGTILPTLQLRDGTTSLGTINFVFHLGAPAVRSAQPFDSVVAPALPAGWLNTASGGSTGWRTVLSPSDTPPNSAFAADPDTISDSTLTSPSIAISTAAAQLFFSHSYDTETGSEPFDGGVLEISYNGGPFSDILAAGGSFSSAGYNGTISTRYNSPIAGRNAWSGNSGGFIHTAVNLPATAAGQNVRLRWRMASDSSQGGLGWYVDSILIVDGYVCCRAPEPTQIVNSRGTNNYFVFSFDTVIGPTYITEFKNTLASNVVWTPLQTNVGDGTMKSVTNLMVSTNRFFRVKTE
jgi:hypothetical protein